MLIGCALCFWFEWFLYPIFPLDLLCWVHTLPSHHMEAQWSVLGEKNTVLGLTA